MSMTLTQALRLVIEGDSKGGVRALDEFGRSLKKQDTPLTAFKRGMQLGGEHAISFRDRVGLVKSGLTKLKEEGLGGVNGAMQNFGTAASGAALKALAWGTAVATAATTAVIAIKSVIDKYIEVGKQVGALSRIAGTSAEESSSLRVQLKMLGLDVDSTSSSFAKFSVALGQAQLDAGSTAGKAFASLGVNLKDQNGDWRDNADVMEEARDKLSQLRKENLNLYRSTSKDIFGKGYMALDKWLGASTQKIKKFKSIASDLGTDWDNDDLAKYLEDSREVSVRWEDFKTMLGQELMPLLSNELIPALRDITRQLQKIPNLGGGISTGLSTAFAPLKEAGVLTANLFGLLGSITQLDFGGVFKSLWEGFKRYLDFMMLTIGGLPGWIIYLLKKAGGDESGDSSASTGTTAATGSVAATATQQGQTSAAQQILGTVSSVLPGLANEGLVKASRGGTIVRLAEAGEDEVVLKASRFKGNQSGTSAKTTVVKVEMPITIEASFLDMPSDSQLDRLTEKLKRRMMPSLVRAVQGVNVG